MFTEIDRARFRRDGFLVARSLLPETPILRALLAIDRLICARAPEFTPSAPHLVREEIHAKLLALAVKDRRTLGVVYDAARKVVPFWELLGSAELTTAANELLESEDVGLAFRGAGIRLDLPGEHHWRSTWHQEYHAQISSPRGFVAWIPFVDVTHSMGPVEIARGSHHVGVLPVRAHDPLNRGRDYTKTFEIPDAAHIAAQHLVATVETRPGDVVFLDFLTLHQSGWNHSRDRVRISGQARFFDMAHSTAIEHGWVGGLHEGHDFTALHPELVIDDEAKRLGGER